MVPTGRLYSPLTLIFMSILQSKRFFVLFALFVVAAKLWLVNAHLLMATMTPHDDLLFINQAHNILSGKWLGEYNQLTLIKGQFYPLFIALSYYLNIPLLAAQQLLYAFASFTAVWAVYPLVRQKWLLSVLYVFLLLNPFSYNYPAVGRVFRLGIYPSLGLLVFSSMVGLYVRSGKSWKQALVWSLGAGIFLSAFWNTREESIWIVPSLLLLFALACFDIRRKSRSRVALLIGLYGLPVVMLLAFNTTLKTINQHHYGVYATIELETPEFESAYGGLLRVKSEQWRQFYPVVKDVRDKAYAVSPAFREVQSYLDGPVGKKWQDLCGCTDIPAAFFIWAFRDSVAAAGYYKDGPRTLDFYQKIGNEIDQACDAGKLDCRPRISSLVPPWHLEYNKLFFPTYFSVLKRIISFQDFSASTDGMLSRGKKGVMFMYEVVTREKLLTSKSNVLKEYPEYHLHLNKEKTRVLNDIGAGYQKIIPAFFLLSLLFFCFSATENLVKREFRLFTVAAGAALGGIMSIGFILTLLAITSYSEIERAMHSAYPMVLLFIIFTVLDLFTRVFSGKKNQDPSTVPGA